MLTGRVHDPVLILLGAAGTLVVFVTLGGMAGAIAGAWRARAAARATTATRPGRLGRALGPFLVGFLITALLQLVGYLLSPEDLSALRGLSSWVVAVAAGLTAGIGWWVGFSGMTDRVPSVKHENPFRDDDIAPFGQGGSDGAFWEDKGPSA
jgi:hypothetical protein